MVKPEMGVTVSDAISMIEELHDSGWPFWAVAEQLNSLSVLTIRGKPWTESTARNAYVRSLEYGKKKVRSGCSGYYNKRNPTDPKINKQVVLMDVIGTLQGDGKSYGEIAVQLNGLSLFNPQFGTDKRWAADEVQKFYQGEQQKGA